MVWLCKTKIWWKFKNLFHGFIQLYFSLETEDICNDIAGEFETRSDTVSFELDRRLPIEEKLRAKLIGLRV